MIPSLMGRKKAVTVIMGLGNETPKKMANGGEAEANPLLVIARELIEAVKAGDEGAVASALEAAWASCEAKEYEQSGDE